VVQDRRNFEAQAPGSPPFWTSRPVEQGTIWRTLDAARQARGWNQRTLSAVSGLSESTVSSWNTHLPSQKSLALVVAALNTHPTAPVIQLQELRRLRREEQLHNDHRHPSARTPRRSEPVGDDSTLRRDISLLGHAIDRGADARQSAKRLEQVLTNLTGVARSGGALGGEATMISELTSRFCDTNPQYARVLLPLRGQMHEQQGSWRLSYDDFVAAARLPDGNFDAGQLLNAASQLLTLGALDGAERLFAFIVVELQPGRNGSCLLPLDLLERRQIVLHALLMRAWIDDIRGDYERASSGLRQLLEEPNLSLFGLEAAVRHRLGRAMVTRGEAYSAERLVKAGLRHLRRSQRLGRKAGDPYFQLWVYYGHSAHRADHAATMTAAGRSHEEIDARKDHLAAHLECVDALESLRAGRVTTAIDSLLAVLETWKALGYSLGAQRTALRLGHALSKVASGPSDYHRAAEHFMLAHILGDRLEMGGETVHALDYANRMVQVAGADVAALEESTSNLVGELFVSPDARIGT
jgi:hypothetical protein